MDSPRDRRHLPWTESVSVRTIVRRVEGEYGRGWAEVSRRTPHPGAARRSLPRTAGEGRWLASLATRAVWIFGGGAEGRR